MTDTEKINFLLKEGEGLTVEFKEHFTPRIDEDIVAFSNTRGGVILLGVRDDQTVGGETLTSDMKARINSVARNCNPPVQVKIKQIQDVVLIEVSQGEEKPYSCGSGYFRRLDGTTQKMTNHELRLMFQENEIVPFEDKIHKGATWDNMSKEKIRNFLKEADISMRKIVPRDILTSLNIAEGEGITNAGVLFFAKDPRRLIVQAQMTLIAFKGLDRVHIYDRQDVQDDLLTQFNAAVLFLMKHLNRRSEIIGVNRKDIYELPFEALREAIANAIIHRDYSVRGTSLVVEVYDDRVEIVNPGVFPRHRKKEFGKISVRRNEHIADLFFRMDKVERAGTGIRRMREAMASAGLMAPKIMQSGFYTIVFKRPVEKGAENLTQKIPRKYPEELTRNQLNILGLLEGDDSLTREQLAEKLNISPETIKKNIEKLKAKKILKRIGPDKGGHWEIVEG